MTDEGEAFWRRFGSRHDKPCKRQSVLTCALWQCQQANQCQWNHETNQLDNPMTHEVYTVSQSESAEEALIHNGFDEMFIFAKSKRDDLTAGRNLMEIASELGEIGARHGFSVAECCEYGLRVMSAVLNMPTRH